MKPILLGVVLTATFFIVWSLLFTGPLRRSISFPGNSQKHSSAALVDLDAPLSDPLPQAALRAQLSLASRFNLPKDSLVFLDVSAETWPDSCLGLPEEGERCAQALVNGYEISFWIDGKAYRVRTNDDGTVLRDEGVVTPGPAY